MDWQGIAAVITALGVIVLGWFQYNQHTKNKETDDRLKKREEEDKEKRNADKVASQNIYRELWSLLHSLDGALRVYIVQPHPLDRAKFISIQYEVLSEGMVSIMQFVHRTPISSLPGFVVELESNEFLFWHSQAEVKDGRARSIMHQIGTDQMVAVRMNGVVKGNSGVVDLGTVITAHQEVSAVAKSGDYTDLINAPTEIATATERRVMTTSELLLRLDANILYDYSAVSINSLTLPSLSEGDSAYDNVWMVRVALLSSDNLTIPFDVRWKDGVAPSFSSWCILDLSFRKTPLNSIIGEWKIYK